MTTQAIRSQDAGKGFLSAQRGVWSLSVFLLAVGMISRLAPLAEPHGRLLRQFMSEDGYLMQTVARNISLGLGMSVSDGTIPTNGVQPLATYIFSLFYLLSGGDRVWGIAGVTLFSAIASLVAAWLLYALVGKILRGSPDAQPIALVVASLWFVSPSIVKNSMNGLETGLYFLVTLATMNVFLSFMQASPSRFTVKQMLGLGLMLGLCFLIRNDAVFFIAAILLVRLVWLWPRNTQQWRDRIIDVTVPGLLSVLIAVPWLVYNYQLFGSIMPISGIAESVDARFGENLLHVPAALVEYVTMILPIPMALKTRLPVVIVSVLVFVPVVALAMRTLWTQSAAGSWVVGVYSIFGVCLIAFYGLFFGAEYFVSRYFSVLSPFLALAAVVTAWRLLALVGERMRRAILVCAAAAVVILALGLNGRLYRNGSGHQHFQVVDWVERNASPQTWVGAVQTGTLGFYHDRTINLDGKVNPEALRARLNEGHVLSYVIRSNIMFLVDWIGIADWAHVDKYGFSGKFTLVLADKAANLAVLKRVSN